MNRVYILQCHEDTGVDCDSVEVFKTLREAATAYNRSLKCAAKIFGDDGYMSYRIPKEEMSEGDINRAYEMTDGGVTHTISLYSQEL
jgi:hypothetical protein